MVGWYVNFVHLGWPSVLLGMITYHFCLAVVKDYSENSQFLAIALDSLFVCVVSAGVLCVGHGDLCQHGGRAGCVNLLQTIQKRVKPLYHVFGHIHEGEEN